MDKPITTRLFFRSAGLDPEGVRQTLARRNLAASLAYNRVTVRSPGGDGVWIELVEGSQVRGAVAALAREADPAWGWELARCDSELVVTCDGRAARPAEVLAARDEVVGILQAATQGFRLDVPGDRTDRYDPSAWPPVTPPDGGAG